MKRDRPYTGQAHTVTGERGKQLVKGLTMRDLRDCYIRGVLQSAAYEAPDKYAESEKGEEAELNANDLYGFNMDKLAPGAIFQNMACEIEKMMGIFPNVPPVKKCDTVEETLQEIGAPIVKMGDLSKTVDKLSE